MEGILSARQKQQEALYWTQFGEVRFVQIYRHAHQERLPIPEKFTRYLRNTLPKQVRVNHPGMLSWNFRIIEISGVLYFEHEWDKFVAHHQLNENDILIFLYTKNKHFDVLIFDPITFCEKESSYFIDTYIGTHFVDPKTHATAVATSASVSPNKIPMHITQAIPQIHLSTTGKDPVQTDSVRVALREHKTNSESMSTEEVSAEFIDFAPSEEQPQPKDFPSPANKSLRDSTISPMTNRRKLPRRNPPKKRKGSTSASSARQSREEHLQISVPEKKANTALDQAISEASDVDMIMIMRRSYISGGFSMTLSTYWAKTYMPNESQNIRLRMGAKVWTIKYIARDVGYAFTGGWKKFATDNILCEDDACLFHIVDDSLENFSLEVKIFRNNPPNESTSPTLQVTIGGMGKRMHPKTDHTDARII